MELISKKSLKDRASEYSLSDDEYKRFCEIIDSEPIAYDTDKVIAQLEERSKEYNSGVRLHGKPEEMLTDEAIYIVKHGGVSTNDLISRSKTIDLLYEIFNKYSMATDKTDALGGFGAEVFKKIREMPTDYSIENK